MAANRLLHMFSSERSLVTANGAMATCMVAVGAPQGSPSMASNVWSQADLYQWAYTEARRQVIAKRRYQPNLSANHHWN